MTTEFDSPKVLIISQFLSLLAVSVSASTGIEGNKLICKETNLCKFRVSSSMVGQTIRNKIGESVTDSLSTPHQQSQSTDLVQQHRQKFADSWQRIPFDFTVIPLLGSYCHNNISVFNIGV